MADKLLHALLVLSVISAAVILLICALRRPMRRMFGARLAYLVWAAVPLAMAAAALPTTRISGPMQQVVAPLRRLAGGAALPAQSGGMQWQPWLAIIWLAVCLAMLAWTWRAHVHYRRSLGPLRRRNGILHSARTTEGPAVVGWWRPQIVVPADFKTRYTAQEQALILAHETAHVQRRDPLANLLCALLQCAFWFHPLIHLAARRFRLDQELACDATVMQARPGARRSYAEAMLKTQLSAQGMLIHCHWQSTHPLKERIMQLQQTPPRKFRMLLGRISIASLVAASTYGATAAGTEAGQAAKDTYMISMQLDAGGASSSPKLEAQEGVPFAVASQGDGGEWRTEFVLNKASATAVFVKALVKHDERVVGNPALLVPLGESAAVDVKGATSSDNFKLKLSVAVLKP